MKILHIITGLGIGGAEVALYNLLAAMRADATYQHVVVCFYHGPLADKIAQLGIEVIVIKGLVKGYDPIGIWQVYRKARAYKPDIVHTALWAANMVGRLLGAWLNVPVINELHGNVMHEGWLRNAFERATVRGVSRLVAVSSSVQAVYAATIIPVLSVRNKVYLTPRLRTIPNGIDRTALLEKITHDPLDRATFGIGPDDFVVGAIGRLEPIKSYDVLINSFAQMQTAALARPCKLLIVGDGSQRRGLELLAKKLNIEDRVIFVGYRLDAYRFYALFDCFALSSQSEGLSIALLEALALGLPVISTNLEQRHDAIIPGVNGLLIPVNDCAAYAHGLVNLCNGHMKKSGQFEPLSDFLFSIDCVVDAYKKMYRELLTHRQ